VKPNEAGNSFTGETASLEAPLRFRSGVNGEVFVDGWGVH